MATRIEVQSAQGHHTLALINDKNTLIDVVGEVYGATYAEQVAEALKSYYGGNDEAEIVHHQDSPPRGRDRVLRPRR